MEEPRILRGPTLPPRLADLTEPPTALYVRGELPRGPAVAVVGTRHSTVAGARFACRLARELAAAGVTVLSGGAKGIDTAAHLGALRARGTTIVVAPAGFAHPFPAENARLFAEVVRRRGAYLSLVPDGVAATRSAFFPRNACMVALAHVVVVVEAGFRSGAGNAASYARKLGRPLFAVPHAPWSPKGQGCLAELRRGAALCTGAADLLRELDRLLLSPIPIGGGPTQPNLPFEDPLGLSADGDRVRAAVAAGATHLDQICEVTGLSGAVVQREILTLSLAGVLAPDRSGRLSLRAGPPAPNDSQS